MTKPKSAMPTKANFYYTAKEVITAETKVTIYETPKPRFEALALPFVRSANQSWRVLKGASTECGEV